MRVIFCNFLFVFNDTFIAKIHIVYQIVINISKVCRSFYFLYLFDTKYNEIVSN